MSISGLVTELNSINAEIKRTSNILKTLRQKKGEVEHNIVEFLREKDQPGVKFQGKAVILETKPVRLSKKKADREADSIRIISRYVDDNPEQVLNEILEARKGEQQEVSKIKIKDISKY
jgi:hypothetical protein